MNRLQNLSGRIANCSSYISSSTTPYNSIAAIQARKNVAANVPRFSFIVIPASVSFNQCFFSRLASSA